MATNSEQDMEALKRDFQSLKSDVSDLSSALKGLLGDEARVAKVKLKKGEQQVEHQIEEHPMTSVGVAMGVGFIIGILLDRKLH